LYPTWMSFWGPQGVDAPLQAAGLLVCLIENEEGVIVDMVGQGTVFFVSDHGHFRDRQARPGGATGWSPDGHRGRPFRVCNHDACVVQVKVHPSDDVAFGQVEVGLPRAGAVPVPLTISSGQLEAGDRVAVLGYPQTTTDSRLSADGSLEFQLTMKPDFFEGAIIAHHPNGFSLVRSAAYETSVFPPAWLTNLGGASGGPLVAEKDHRVYGLLSTSSEMEPGAGGYSVCTDIVSLLNWSLIGQVKGEPLTIREASARSPRFVRVT
jgi:hypothetical protein